MLQFLTGLALLTIALGVLAYIIAGVAGFRLQDLQRFRVASGKAIERVSPRESKPVNAHLVGSIAKVIGHSDNSERPMRVRINLESWPARNQTSAEWPVEVGCEVKVMEVDGPVLVVEKTDGARD